jgi:hypothetical protein
MHSELWWRNILEKIHFEEQKGDGRIPLQEMHCEDGRYN